ncbi:hypothetical protein L2E82_03051 [Cichorium intybus]|uniref:Uncharacterized protein n=1 Tax=Cichorium intybus TaxID=13427 RepID=A0ACB9H2V7_CICIN|nr:hypothetical protein L1887_03253 [Cichorium endivia]KAI3790194.1 hypothetical protein L2E82_03051 [Cichorium intybus]
MISCGGWSITGLVVRSLARLVAVMVEQPAASVTTILYRSGILPQNSVLGRFVHRGRSFDDDNPFFDFIVNFLRCLW